MNRAFLILLVIVGALAGLILGVLSNWIYDLLRQKGHLPDRPTLKRLVLILLSFLPAFLLFIFSETILNTPELTATPSVATLASSKSTDTPPPTTPTATLEPSPIPTPTSTPTPTPLALGRRLFVPIPLVQWANRNLADAYIDFPTGPNARQGALGDVPFLIPPTGNNWLELDGGEVVIPVDVERPEKLYLLLTVSHADYVKACTLVRFVLGRDYHSKQLEIGVDVREWAIGRVQEASYLVVTTTSPTTQEVWRGETAGSHTAIVDRIEIDLTQYGEGPLSEIVIRDTAGDIMITNLLGIAVEVATE